MVYGKAGGRLAGERVSFGRRVARDIGRRPVLYLMLLPVLAYYILFCYKPMYGALIAFTNYRPGQPILSSWVGLKNFRDFFGARLYPPDPKHGYHQRTFHSLGLSGAGHPGAVDK